MYINDRILNGPYKLKRVCFGYHITTNSCFEKIITQGLKPKIGKRSKSIGEEIKGVFFFEGLELLPFWIDTLYGQKDLESLKVLRLHLMNLQWYVHNGGEDYFLRRCVSVDRLDYLRMMKCNGKLVPINYLPGGEENIEYEWSPCKGLLIK